MASWDVFGSAALEGTGHRTKQAWVLILALPFDWGKGSNLFQSYFPHM